MFCLAEAGESEEAVLAVGREMAAKVYGRFGQSEVVEDQFHQLRLAETQPGGAKQRLSISGQ
eukprot:8941559-Lingulodinium_polyedra.AAC.1